MSLKNIKSFVKNHRVPKTNLKDFVEKLLKSLIVVHKLRHYFVKTQQINPKTSMLLEV